MAIEEHARHALHGRLEDVLGSDEAATLMSYLPPVGWADVATKQDLSVVRGDVKALQDAVGDLRDEVRELRSGLEDLRRDSAAQVRTFMLATSASVLTTASLAFAAARFA